MSTALWSVVAVWAGDPDSDLPSVREADRVTIGPPYPSKEAAQARANKLQSYLVANSVMTYVVEPYVEAER